MKNININIRLVFVTTYYGYMVGDVVDSIYLHIGGTAFPENEELYQVNNSHYDGSGNSGTFLQNDNLIHSTIQY